MTALIVSLPGDVHALVTKWALERRGIATHFISWSDFPQLLGASFEVATDRPSGVSLSNRLDADFAGDIDILWNHRTLDAVPPPEIDAADHPPIAQSSDSFRRGLIARLEKQAFTVNPSAAKWIFDNKLTQLSLAQQCGFRIPATLISNDLARIETFLAANGPCIVKPLRFMRWDAKDRNISSYTTTVPDLRGIDPLAVTSCPMIYQERIDKVAEFRVVVFGAEILCFRLGSQQDERASLDWRSVDYRALPTEAASLPEPLARKVLAYVKACGFVSGSMDLALTPSGEYVFFELNETGQFIWLEENCPEIPMVDIFSGFLASRDPDYRYDWRPDPLRYSDWVVNARDVRRADYASHVVPVMDKRFPDKVV
jgi:hypothetical protein